MEHAPARAWTRRRTLWAAGLGGLAAAAVPAVATAAPERPGRPRTGRIDTHHHAVTPAMRQWAIDNGLLPPVGGPSWVNWSAEGALAMMETNRILAAVVSAPVPSVAFEDPALAEAGVRVCNESNAELVAAYPDRFGFFANVAPLHPDLAIEQARYALDELGAEGIILMTQAGGRYLGDAIFDPLFAELNRRRAVVFTHPDRPPDVDIAIDGVEDFVLDFMYDTTRAALNLIASGTTQRYPDLTIILSHAGGFLPYVAGRVESAGRRGEAPDPETFRAALRRFYYDTAMPASPYATPSLLAAAGPGRILYGTDYAARPADEVARVTADLDRDPALDRDARYAVDQGNARQLFPGLAARLPGQR